MARLVDQPISSPEGRTLEREMSAEIVVRYGGDEFEPPADEAQFASPDGAFLVAYLEVDGGDLVPVGCGGIRRIGPLSCELKRMFVREEARGRGIARDLLAGLEERAAAAGFTVMQLETGTAQPEAIALYESCDYQPIANYGAYADDPRSRCYAKSLSSRT